MFFKVLNRSAYTTGLRVVLVCAVLWTPLSWTSSVRADVKDAKPGDYLEVRVNNEWRKCKVLSVTRTGRQIRVRVEGTGQTLNYTADRYRELPSDKPAPPKDDGDKPAPKGDFRIWTDITGKFRIEARFVAIENDAVKLVRQDGTSISVPLAKLSTADREFAKNIKTDMKSDDDNPFKVDDSPPMPKSDVGDATTTPPRSRTAGSATSLTPGGRVEVEIPSTVTPTDASRAREVIPARPSKFSYEPDPVEARQLSDDPIGLPKKKDRSFEKITNFALDQSSLIAAVSRNAFHGPSKGFCEIDLLDLGSANLLNTIAFSPNANARDLIAQPDNIRFVTTSDDQKRVDIWERSETGLTHLTGWLPFKDKKVEFAGFADSDHLLTIGDGKLVGWTCQSAKPTYSMKIKNSPPPTFSPGRKYLVAGHDLGLVVLHAASGKLVAVLDDNGPAINTIRFSPDGMRLATLTTFRQLKIWSLSDGTMLDEVSMTSRFTTGFTWPAENYLLVNSVNSGLLYDIERRVFLWQYKSVGNDLGLTQVQDDQFVFIASSQDSRAVFPAVAPHAKPLAMAKQLNPADLLVLIPGAKGSNRMDPTYTHGDKKKAFDAISKKLRDNGVEVVQSGSLVFVAVSKKGKPQEVTYRGIGSFDSTKRTITPLLYSLTLYEGQNNIYQASGSGGPSFMISMKQGESIDDALRRLSQPSPTFFVNLKMPKLLARPAPGKVAYGASQMTFGGMKPSEPDVRK